MPKSKRKKAPKVGTAAAAIITLHAPGSMTPEGRKEIADWMRRAARDLVKHGGEYNDVGRFTARYMYTRRSEPGSPAYA